MKDDKVVASLVAAKIRPSKEKAVIRLQACFRGRRARRLRIVQQAKKAKKGIVAPPPGIKPPSETNDNSIIIDKLRKDLAAQKSISQSRLSDIRERDFKLSLNADAISSLNSQIQDSVLQVEILNDKNQELESKLKTKESALSSLKSSSVAEDAEFKALQDILATREGELEAQSKVVTKLTTDLEKEGNEVARLGTIIRRLTKQNEALAPPETCEVALSARSFEENQLISLRDDAIAAKTQEIWLLTGHNDRLTVQIDKIEAEVLKLQGDVISRENQLATAHKEIKGYKKTIAHLSEIAQESSGREKAMQVVLSQNDNLLTALQLAEKKAEGLERDNITLTNNVATLERNLKEYLEKSSVNEVEALTKAKTAELKSASLSSLRATVAAEREAIHAELAALKSSCRIKVESMEAELNVRREKQYKLLAKLQVYEGREHEFSESGIEDMKAEVAAATERMAEMQLRLDEASSWREKMTETLEVANAEKHQALVAAKDMRSATDNEKEILKSQLAELNATVSQRVENIKSLESEIAGLNANIESQNTQISNLKDRVARMIAEATSESKSKSHIELQNEVLTAQLKDVTNNMAKNIKSLTEHNEAQVATNAKVQAKLDETLDSLASVSWGKFRLVELYCNAIASSSSSSARNSTLCLAECELTDPEVSSLANVLSATNCHIATLDLRRNHITDNAIPSLIALLYKAKQVVTLDLRYNHISITGTRKFASAMAAHRNWRDNYSVNVQTEGRITVSENHSTSKAMVTIDIRENTEESAAKWKSKGSPKKKKLIKKPTLGSSAASAATAYGELPNLPNNNATNNNNSINNNNNNSTTLPPVPSSPRQH